MITLSANELMVIELAKQEILAAGWTVEEFTNRNGQVHIEFEKEGCGRLAWGLFDRLYAWTEAYERLIGKCWVKNIAVKVRAA